jgi:hypothetical protein
MNVYGQSFSIVIDDRLYYLINISVVHLPLIPITSALYSLNTKEIKETLMSGAKNTYGQTRKV